MASKYVSHDIYYKCLASKQDSRVKATQYVITKHVSVRHVMLRILDEVIQTEPTSAALILSGLET
jgi:hypothetical protein